MSSAGGRIAESGSDLLGYVLNFRDFRGSRSGVEGGSSARVQVHGFGGPVGARRAPIMNPSTGVSITTSLCRVKMNRALKRSGRDTLDVEAQTPQVLTGAVHNLCVCRVININTVSYAR